MEQKTITKITVEDVTALNPQCDYGEFYLKESIERPGILEDEYEPHALRSLTVHYEENGQDFGFILDDVHILVVPKTNISAFLVHKKSVTKKTSDLAES